MVQVKRRGFYCEDYSFCNNIYISRMPPILSSSKAVARFLSGKKRCLDLGVWSGLVGSHPEAGKRTARFAQTRCLASFAGCGSPCIGEVFHSGEVLAPSVGYSHRYDQRRWFLGCGDAEEGTILSKIYEERRVIGYASRACSSGQSHFVIYLYVPLLCSFLEHYTLLSFLLSFSLFILVPPVTAKSALVLFCTG